MGFKKRRERWWKKKAEAQNVTVLNCSSYIATTLSRCLGSFNVKYEEEKKISHLMDIYYFYINGLII